MIPCTQTMRRLLLVRPDNGLDFFPDPIQSSPVSLIHLSESVKPFD